MTQRRNIIYIYFLYSDSMKVISELYVTAMNII